MKNSRITQNNRLSTTSFRRVSFGPVEAPLQPKKAPEIAPGKVGPQPPIQPVSERFPALEKQQIIFTLFAPEAREVTVAGNFNYWRPDATPLKNKGNGKWVVCLMLRSGQYEYRFVVDGRWSEDPRVSQHVANPYGGFNSVIIVPLAVRTSIL